MKKSIILLIVFLMMLSSCTVSSNPQETTDADSNGSLENSISDETEPYVQTTEMFGEYYPVVEDTWHLSDWKETHPPIKQFWYYEPIDFSPEAMKTYVKLPLEYEETVDGVTIKVEFFQDTYPIFSYIQARITFTNNTGINLRFIDWHKPAAGYFATGGKNYCGCYESPDYNFDTTNDTTTLVPNGESHVVEVIYLFTNRFDPNKTDHTYNIESTFWIEGTNPLESVSYAISFPIEVLKHE